MATQPRSDFGRQSKSLHLWRPNETSGLNTVKACGLRAGAPCADSCQQWRGRSRGGWQHATPELLLLLSARSRSEHLRVVQLHCNMPSEAGGAWQVRRWQK